MRSRKERNQYRQESIQSFNSVAKELLDIEEEKNLTESTEHIWTIDTSSFLTLICC